VLSGPAKISRSGGGGGPARVGDGGEKFIVIPAKGFRDASRRWHEPW
jgi:hypothetical protein